MARKKFQKIPTWVDPVLQGLSYWIGHRQAYYKDYPLFEGAITAELCNLLNSNISHRLDGYLYCEVPYKNFGVSDRSLRADLVIANTKKFLPIPEREDLKKYVSTVIEVKRGCSSKLEITKDLERLANIKSDNPKIRTFLVVVSENKLPKQYKWFTKNEFDDDVASKKSTLMDGGQTEFKVRRVCKSFKSIKSQSNCNSAMLIEVDLVN